MLKRLLYLKENYFEKTAVPNRKKVQNKVRTTFRKTLQYLKEKAVENYFCT